MRTLAVLSVLLCLAAAPAAAAAVKPPAADVVLRPVTDGDYFKTAREMIGRAGESIHLALSQVRYYKNHPESASNILIDEVIRAFERGVKVEVCLDYSDHLREATLLNLEVGRRLAEAGIPVYLSPPDKTMHAKILLVDGEKTLLGSTNWSYFSLDRNREANLLAECPETAAYFSAYFKRMKGESLLLSTPGDHVSFKGEKAINPNTASVETLETLPGIGPSLAGRIVESRRVSPFSSPESLLSVPGIGEKTLEGFRSFLFFEEKNNP